MEKFKLVRGVKVMSGTKTFELLDSKDPADHKKAKRLMEFCDKAEACFYEVNTLRKLREEYSDVI